MDGLLARLATEHRTFPGAPREKGETYLPEDLAKFYHHTDGAEICGRGNAAACRFVAMRDFERLDWGKVPETPWLNSDFPNGHIWYRLAWLADGSCLAINPRPRISKPWRERIRQNPHYLSQWDHLVAICHCSASTQGKPGSNPVVALTFEDLLQGLLDGGESFYWLKPEFVSHGDAEEFTRRD